MADQAKKKILLIDDDPYFREKLERALEKEECYSLDVMTGLEGVLDRVRETTPSLALISADFEGIETLCAEWFKDRQTRRTAYLMLLYQNRPENLVAWYQKLGAVGYVSKILLVSVLEAINQYFIDAGD
ncbi:MAG TPA: hypothetical protein PKL97_06710 [Candidatus Omnitrophota bacterium]|nr:hypothetical protein [Candidatus Omnitrophota bacterium]